MQWVFHLFLGLLLAFAAALPLGPVNLAVVQHALNRGRRAGLWVAAGSAVTELLWCLLAVAGSRLIFPTEASQASAMLWLKVLSIPMLLALGTFDLTKRIPRPKLHLPAALQPRTRGGSSFWVGLSLNLLNPMLLPFWLALSSYLWAADVLQEAPPLLGAYILGVGLGTFCTGFLIATVAGRRRKKMSFRTRVYITRGVGWLFVGFALWQCFSLLAHYIHRVLEQLAAWPLLRGFF